MKLNQVRDNEGARKERMRIARGYGSGKGRTAGRGVKGQTSRSGVAINGFEGGQMPIYRRLPKRGFNNIFRLDYVEVNLSRLQAAIDAGSLDAGKEINAVSLMEAGVVRRAKDGIRILGKGELKSKVTVHVAGISTKAKEAIEKLGGQVIIDEKPEGFKPKKKA
ncbi:MAG: 50S ribosomal protein L15 [Alphaproteobacteria bacterium]|nr:50S ribosomal protein L15 [Alphaproteobacteria bacterium]